MNTRTKTTGEFAAVAPHAPTLDQHGGGFGTAARFGVVAILAFGILLPVTGVWLGELLFPARARGSLVERDGRVIGSTLIAQPFAHARYFQPRPSAAGYDPRAMSGSNLAASNPALRERIAASSADVATRERVEPSAIPSDLVTASGSGMDPHISPAAARLQAARVAEARGLPIAAVQALIDEHIEGPSLGVLGQARVNVLELNLALDEASPAR